MVLKILNSVLTEASKGNLSHNPHLLYAILYQQQLFVPFRNHPTFGKLVENIEKVIEEPNRILTIYICKFMLNQHQKKKSFFGEKKIYE